jgi:hypothetical protein
MAIHRKQAYLALGTILAALCSASAMPADDHRVSAVEKLLSDSGFVAVADAPFEPEEVDYENDAAFRLLGTASQPTLESAWCGPPETVDSFVFKTGSLVYLVENKGEWGGSLSVGDGDAEMRKLVRENVVNMSPDGDRLMVFTGLEHGDSAGGVYAIDDYKTLPTVRPITRLPESPRVIVERPREILPSIFVAIGQRSISAVDSNYRFDVYMAGHPLPSPNSALIDGGHIYVGVCGGVADVVLPGLGSRSSAAKRIPLIRYWVPRGARK